MAVKLTCPACRDVVTAEDADRGSNVKCGTCWADVAVPAGDAPPPPPVLTVKPLAADSPRPATAAPLPVAKALPLSAAAPVAKAVPMRPMRPTPLKPVGSRGDADDRRRDPNDRPAKPRFKRRDDDEDDDHPDRSRSSGGKGVLIAFVCLGLFLLLGVVGGVVLLVRGLGGGDTAAATNAGAPAAADPWANGVNTVPKPAFVPDKLPPQVGGDFDPGKAFDPPPEPKRGKADRLPRGFNPIEDPVEPKPLGAKPVAAVWKPVENKGGFAAEAPPGVRREKHSVELEGGQVLGGMKYTAEDEQAAYWVYHHDLPTDDGADQLRIARKLVHDVFPHEVNGAEDVTLDGKPAVKLAVRHFHGGMTAGYSAKVGHRVFTVFVTSRQGIPRAGDPNLEERQKKFLDSVRLRFDPKTHDPFADEPEWVPMAKTVGFTASVPKQATTDAEHSIFFDSQARPGRAWKTETDGLTFEVFAHEIPLRQRPSDFERTIRDVIKWFTDRERVHAGPERAKLSGYDADEYQLKAHNRQAFVRFTQVGRVVFTAKVTPSGWDKRAGDREIADKARKFFDSIRVGAAPPQAPVGKPAGGPGTVGGAGGEFVTLAAGKVKPFWAAAVLTDKKELLTFGVRDPSGSPPGGVLRRYSLPDFKLLATYHLPQPVHRVAVDERKGKVYAATVSSAVDAKMPEREAAIVNGDVHVYDLRKITSGTLAELDEVKPLVAPYHVGAKVAGLHVSPSDDTLYVGCVTTSGTGARRSFTGKLVRYDTATGAKVGTDLSFAAPVWATALSWDGRRLALVERPTDGAGNPKGGGTLVLLDAPNWKVLKATPLTGVPWDVTFLKDLPAAVEHDGGTPKLTVADLAGETAQVSLPADTRYAEGTADGKGLLTAVGGAASGLTLYEVEAVKPLKLTTKASGVDAGGLFALTPDGKLVVTNTGVVIDAAKSGGK